FTGVPAFAGLIEYEQDGSPAATLAMMQALVANQGDGWKSTLEELDRFYEQVSGRPAEDMPQLPPGLLFQQEAELPEAALEAIGLSAEVAIKLGRRTAEMHLALGADTTEPDFAPEPFTQADPGR